MASCNDFVHVPAGLEELEPGGELGVGGERHAKEPAEAEPLGGGAILGLDEADLGLAVLDLGAPKVEHGAGADVEPGLGEPDVLGGALDLLAGLDEGGVGLERGEVPLGDVGLELAAGAFDAGLGWRARWARARPGSRRRLPFRV
jgi:hypothetical protein